MLCEFCVKEYAEKRTQLAPAEAVYWVSGQYVPKPLALCADHANCEVETEGYRVTPIVSEPKEITP